MDVWLGAPAGVDDAPGAGVSYVSLGAPPGDDALRSPAMHIGLIGGIGPKATSFYYESIARAFAAASTPLRLTIAHTELSVRAKNLMSDNKQAQAKEFERRADGAPSK